MGELAEPRDTAHLLEVLGEGKVGDRVLDGRAREGDGQRHRREEVRNEQLEDALPLDVALRLVRHRVDVLRGEGREEQQRRLVDGRLRVADERADRADEGVLAQLGAELPRLLALELVGELRELGEAIREVLRLLRAQERREGQGDVARRVLVLVVHAGGGAGGGLGRDGRGLGRHSSASIRASCTLETATLNLAKHTRNRNRAHKNSLTHSHSSFDDAKTTFNANCTNPKIKPVPFGPHTKMSLAEKMP